MDDEVSIVLIDVATTVEMSTPLEEACLDDAPMVVSDEDWCDRYGFFYSLGTKLWYDAEGRFYRKNGLHVVETVKGDRRWIDCDGSYHRDGGLPAVEYGDGVSQEWWCDGVRHRDDGLPAVIRRILRIVGKVSFVIVYEWWVDGRKHREGGLPAVMWNDRGTDWCEHGVEIPLPRDSGWSRLMHAAWHGRELTFDCANDLLGTLLLGLERRAGELGPSDVMMWEEMLEYGRWCDYDTPSSKRLLGVWQPTILQQ